MAKVSVCIPTYNRSALLSCAIDSVLAQDYSDFEIVVCDDGSKDDTPKMMANLSDPRIRYVRHEQNIGKSNNMISGFKAARGEYFIKFDDDDRLTPQFLSATTAILDRYPDIDFVSTDHWVIDDRNQREIDTTDANSKHWGRTELPEGKVDNLPYRVFVRQNFQVGATLFRKRVLEEVNYMRPDLQSCEDNDLFVKLALAGKQAYYLPERLMEYRFHEEQQQISKAIAHLKAKIQYLDYYDFDDPELEQIRQNRLQETKILLGLRLVEIGETEAGKALLKEGESHSPQKAKIGQLIAAFPQGFRPLLFGIARYLKPTSGTS